MAYSNSASERMDELRFRNQTSPRSDTSFLGLVSPPRNGNRVSQPSHSQDARGGLMRRFTTDSGRVPTISSITSSRGGAQEQDYGPSVRCSFIPFLRYFTVRSLAHVLHEPSIVAKQYLPCIASPWVAIPVFPLYTGQHYSEGLPTAKRERNHG